MFTGYVYKKHYRWNADITAVENYYQLYKVVEGQLMHMTHSASQLKGLDENQIKEYIKILN